MENKAGKVYLVGAGCGAADLISLRGLELIRRCDVLIYDDLIAPELLDFAPANAERIYMGKRSGRHSASQQDICRRLKDKASEGKSVVRLKGGDPFVFGRGGEELLYLMAAGIPFEEVPGISSAIAIPAQAGIPVTHRGLSGSVHIITAHTAQSADGLPENFDALAGLPGTLVFLMGLSKLSAIAQRLMRSGMSAETPAAVISGGNSPKPVSVRGRLIDIAQKTAKAGVEAPAVIVVGAVAALELVDSSPKPLAGLRVGITGTGAIAGKLRRGLYDLGAIPVIVQSARVAELPVDYDFHKLCSGSRLLVFTSQNGVELFFRRMAREGIDLRRIAQCRFAVIGTATEKALAAHGIWADIRPAQFDSKALAQAILEQADRDCTITLFRSAKATKTLPQRLSPSFNVEDVHIYDMLPGQSCEALPPLDYLCFSSAGGVKLFLEQFKAIPSSVCCAAIGQETKAELQLHQVKNILCAQEATASGLVKAIAKAQLISSPANDI